MIRRTGGVQPENIQRILNYLAAKQLVDNEMGGTEPQDQGEQFDTRSYLEQPEMPYLEGLSPMARYRDMSYRDQGRRYKAMQALGDIVRETERARQEKRPTLMEDVQMGVTRQPDGRVATEAGAVIEPIRPPQHFRLPALTPQTAFGSLFQPQAPAPIAGRTLTSPYGTGSSTIGTTPPTGGTFSFINSAGEKVEAPFASLRNPKFMKYMQEEEAANRMRGGAPKKSMDRTYEDLMAQIESIQ